MQTEASSPTPRSPFPTEVIRWLSLRAYGLVMRSLFRPRTPPQIMRRRFERFGGTSRAAVLARHPSVVFGDHRVGELAIESIRATPRPASVLLYLHGGAFVMGLRTRTAVAPSGSAYRCDAEVLVPDYRLAPEHPFPAALEDALAAWRALGSIAGRPALVGRWTPAGGGLALSLMVRLRDWEYLARRRRSPSRRRRTWPAARSPAGTVTCGSAPEHLRRWRRHTWDARTPRPTRLAGPRRPLRASSHARAGGRGRGARRGDVPLGGPRARCR